MKSIEYRFFFSPQIHRFTLGDFNECQERCVHSVCEFEMTKHSHNHHQQHRR